MLTFYSEFILARYRNARLFLNIIYYVAFYFIALEITVAGVLNLFNPLPMLENLRSTTQLPTLVLIGVVSFIAIFETLIGLFLFFRVRVKENLLILSIFSFLLFIYTVFCFSIGVPGEAGFWGGIIQSNFDFTTVINNSMILLITVLLFVKESS